MSVPTTAAEFKAAVKAADMANLTKLMLDDPETYARLRDAAQDPANELPTTPDEWLKATPAALGRLREQDAELYEALRDRAVSAAAAGTRQGRSR